MAAVQTPPRTDDDRSTGLVGPAKAVRLLGLLSEGLAELRRVEPDEVARRELVARHSDVLVEVASTMSDRLIDELVTLGAGPLDPDASLDELIVAEAQLFGWLNGVLLAEAQFGTQDGEIP